MKFLTRVGVSLVALATLLPANLASAGAIELKLAYFVGDQHAMSQWLVKWANDLERESGGRITVKRFPGSQMGPVQQHYDFVRTGQADVAWFLHGATPGRFKSEEHTSELQSRRDLVCRLLLEKKKKNCKKKIKKKKKKTNKVNNEKWKC